MITANNGGKQLIYDYNRSTWEYIRKDIRKARRAGADGDDAGGGRIPIVHLPAGQRGKFQEGTVGIKNGFDAVVDKQFAPAQMAVDGALGAGNGRFPLSLGQLFGQSLVVFVIGFEVGAVDV